MEAVLTHDGTGVLSWSAAYALAWTDGLVDGVWRPRTLDQRHTVNLGAAWRIGDAWQLSGSWQYHTGWPFTEQFLDLRIVEGMDGQTRVNFLDRGFGPLNAERLPAYHRLDLRGTRAFTLPDSRLEVYLDVFNAYNRRNLRGLAWSLRANGDGSFRAARGDGEEQLPIMPTLGLRWVF